MSDNNSSMKVAVCDVGGISGPDPAAGVGVAAGGISGPDSSALDGGTAAKSATTITTINVSLFISLPPFLQVHERASISLNPPDWQYLFAHFWEIRSAGHTTEALDLCDLILELLPDDDSLRLRHSNAVGMGLRDRHDLRGAYRAHLLGRPFLKSAELIYTGDHYHGLGVTLSRMGAPVRAYKAFESARHFHAGDAVRLAHTDINTAELLAGMNRPAEGHRILDGVREESLRASVYVARARCYEAEGDTANARRSLADAQYVLADSTDGATRTEALEVLTRIEGSRRDG